MLSVRGLLRSAALRRPLLRRGEATAPAEAAEDYVSPVSGPGTGGVPSPAVADLVDRIANLTLAQAPQLPPTASSYISQVVELNEALRVRLGLPDLSALAVAAPAAAPASAAPAQEEVQEKKTSFKVVLSKFDDTKKIALIKEIKGTIPGINLVQAKKFVESVPKAVVEDVGKDEAEKIKTALEAVGGSCDIE